jgi:muramidase (phage lysozyme)
MTRLALAAPIAAFLDLVALSEGTSAAKNTHDDGYDIIVSGINGLNSFADYSAHPFAAGRAPIIVRTAPTLLESTASGRYQIILPTWKNIAAAHGLGTFSPQNQDMGAVELLNQCGALNLIDAQKIPQAIEAACETWASFPGNSFGQGGRTLDWLMQQYAALLAPMP